PPSFCPVFPFLFFDAVDYPDLHSFPTRRSSDLTCSDPPVSTGRLPTLRDPGGAAEHGCLGQPCARPPLVDMGRRAARSGQPPAQDRKSTRLNSSHVKISYAVFCLKKKKNPSWLR